MIQSIGLRLDRFKVGLAMATIVGTLVASGGTAAAQSDWTTVSVTPNGTYGMLMTDPDGWTLYMWAGDEPGVSNCYDSCADAWPPYLTDSDPVAPPGLPAELSAIDRGDGTWQVTFDNRPLYYFSGDVDPGDANGQGLAGFGAPWTIVSFSPPPQAQQDSYGTPPAQLGAGPQSFPPAPVQPQSQQQSAPPVAQQQPPSAYNAFYGGQQPQQGYAPFPGAPLGYAPRPIFAPTGSQTLLVQGPPNGIVSLSWAASPAAMSYRVYQTQISQPLNLTVTQTIQQPTGQLKGNALLTSLTPGITYIVQVRAVDANGQETPTPSSVIVGPSLGR